MYWHLQKTVTIKGQFGWIFINKITKINSDASVHCAEYSRSIFPRTSALPLEWQRWHLTGQEYIHVGPIFSIPKCLCTSPVPRLSSRRKSSNMRARSWIFPLGYWAWPINSFSSSHSHLLQTLISQFLHLAYQSQSISFRRYLHFKLHTSRTTEGPATKNLVRTLTSRWSDLVTVATLEDPWSTLISAGVGGKWWKNE